MSIKLEISLEQVKAIIQQLPKSDIEKIKSELSSLSTKKTTAKKIKDLLLSGPTMSTKQYKSFLEQRKEFNKWRVN